MRVCLLALLACSVLACSSRPAATPPIHHLVVVWLKQPGNAEHRQRLIDESRRLRAIPGVLSVDAGSVIPSDRPVVDSSFDVAIAFVLADRQALSDYVDHPIHRQLLEQTIQPLVARYRVFDFSP